MKARACKGIVLCVGALAATVLILQVAQSAEPESDPTTPSPAVPTVRWHRSAQVIGGQEEEAQRFAQKMTEYLSRNHPDVTVRAFTEKSGTTLVMHGFVDAQDLATLQRTRAKYFTEGEFLKLFATARGIFVESSAREALLVAVD